MSIKELREAAGMTIPAFAAYFNIPYRTMQNWEYNKRQCPQYVIELIEYKLIKEKIIDIEG